MSAQTARLQFRSHVAKSQFGGWTLTTRQQTIIGGISDAEFRFSNRLEATKEAIRLAYLHRGPVADWPISMLSAEAAARAARPLELPHLTAEAEATANAYLRENPGLQQQWADLLANWPA